MKKLNKWPSLRKKDGGSQAERTSSDTGTPTRARSNSKMPQDKIFATLVRSFTNKLFSPPQKNTNNFLIKKKIKAGIRRLLRIRKRAETMGKIRRRISKNI